MNIDNYIDLSLPREYGLNLDHFKNTPLTKHSLYSIEAEIMKFLKYKLSTGEIYKMPIVLIFAINSELVVDVFYDRPAKETIEKLKYIFDYAPNCLANFKLQDAEKYIYE